MRQRIGMVTPLLPTEDLFKTRQLCRRIWRMNLSLGEPGWLSRGIGALKSPADAVSGLVPVVLMVALAVSGCSSMSGGAEVFFSPDGTLVAYAYAKQWDLPLPPECPTIRSRVWIRWCKLHRPTECHSVEIGVFGKDFGGYDPKNSVHPVFSPDNRYLAVACPRHLHLIDCVTKKRRIMTGPDEVVTSLIWLDANRLAYASSVRDRPGGRRSTTCLWHQRVDQLSHERRLVFSQEAPDAFLDKGVGVTAWPRERWSPGGAFVLLRTRGFHGDLRLLDVAAQTARDIAPAGYNFEGIAWKCDGSAAVCVGAKRSSSMLAFLIDPRTLQKHDFSREFNDAFGSNSGFSPPRITSLWTPGDEYFVVNDSRTGGCLVSPRPWRIIPVAKRLIDRLGEEGSLVLAKDPSVRLPWIFRQPAKDWVRVWVQFQEQGYRRGVDYLVDYSGRSFVAVGESGAPGGGWKTTPDGKQLVKLAGYDKLVVRSFQAPVPPGR